MKVEELIEIAKTSLLYNDILLGYVLINSDINITKIDVEETKIIRSTVGITDVHHGLRFSSRKPVITIDKNYIEWLKEKHKHKKQLVREVTKIFAHEIFHIFYRHPSMMLTVFTKTRGSNTYPKYLRAANIIGDYVVNEKLAEYFKWYDLNENMISSRSEDIKNFLMAKFGEDAVIELKITPLHALELNEDELNKFLALGKDLVVTVIDIPDDEDVDAIEARQREISINAVTLAKTQGKAALGMLIEIEQQFVYKPPWDLKFTKVFDSTIHEEYSLTKLNYQYAMASELFRGVINCEDMAVASLVGEICKVAIAIDSSGSMLGELPEYLEKIAHIVSVKGMKEIFVVCGDVDAHVIGTFKLPLSVNDFKKITKSLHGGGGTDFRPLFKTVEEEYYVKNKETMAAMILLTDTYGTFPEKRPPFRTIVVTLEDPEHADIPEWAEIVYAGR